MKRALLLSAASLFTVTAATPVLAPDAPAPAAASADQDDSEIVVTAQLREQRIGEVRVAGMRPCSCRI